MSTRWMAATAVLAVCALGQTATSEAEIVNGDFATDDLTGWEADAFDSGSAPIVKDPFISVGPLGTGDAVFLSTGAFEDGLFLLKLEQSFIVDPEMPVLAFDFSLPTYSDDATGAGDSLFPDVLFALVDSPSGLADLLAIEPFGPVVDPLGSAPGSVFLDAPSDDAFDHGLFADLSAFAGEEVILVFDLTQEDDGSSFEELAISNVRLEVPEPASAALVGLGVMAAFSRRQRA